MTTERAEEIYNELTTLMIELDPEPASRGPAYLQDLISKTRGYLNRTSLIAQEVHRERHAVERQLDAQETAFQASSDELLADDARVSRLPSIDDRRAMINLLLREDRNRIADYKRQIKELGFVEKAVRLRHRELDSTVSSIRMQKSLIDSEIRTGSSYGDETDTSRGSIHGRRSYTADDIDEDELAKLLNGTVEEPSEKPAIVEPGVAVDIDDFELEGSTDPLAQPVGASSAPQPKIEDVEGTAEEDEFTRFLDGEDYSDILNSV